MMLHGIYGRGRNWTTLAQHLSRARPDWASLLVDLRLHGASPDFTPPHTVASAAADLVVLEDETRQEAAAVLGHSFGGKVALVHAAGGHDHLSQVWIIDSTPEAREPRGSAWRLLDVVRSLPAAFPSRAVAAEGIAGKGYSSAVAAWMVSNLRFDHGRYVWRLDFDAMEALLRDFFRTDLWDVVEAPPPGTSLHFVKANDSAVLSEEGCTRMEEAGRRHGQVHLHRVDGGHWLHVDNPDAILRLLATHLPLGPAAHPR
jgi:pimeloyl-ACP methyl ester carboxylesterase